MPGGEVTRTAGNSDLPSVYSLPRILSLVGSRIQRQPFGEWSFKVFISREIMLPITSKLMGRFGRRTIMPAVSSAGKWRMFAKSKSRVTIHLSSSLHILKITSSDSPDSFSLNTVSASYHASLSKSASAGAKFSSNLNFSIRPPFSIRQCVRPAWLNHRRDRQKYRPAQVGDSW